MKTTVACPTCGKPVLWADSALFRPFCSERCRLIDLGEWASETRRIPSETADPNGQDDGSDPN
jgi:endogenous inhibitor of DNA gyrase (YacG/DUF329 family)